MDRDRDRDKDREKEKERESGWERWKEGKLGKRESVKREIAR